MCAQRVERCREVAGELRLLCVIDHFGSGGAQRQMVALACGLKQRGHQVEMFIYHPRHSFFRSRVDMAQIPIHEVSKRETGSIGVVLRLRHVLREGRYDGVISFLSSPNAYSELASIGAAVPKLIVSERSSHLRERPSLYAVLGRFLHVRADYVVANSHSHADWLRRRPWLRRKTVTVYNGVDCQVRQEVTHPRDPGALRLLAVGRIEPGKNVHRLIEALALVGREIGQVPLLTWAGRRDPGKAEEAYVSQIERQLRLYPLVREQWRWAGEHWDISQLLATHHALVHPSLYEGLPNAVCEALAAGRPVLASDVCDNAQLVANGTRGFLFDPRVPQSIADAVHKLIELQADEWRVLSDNARRYAGTYLTTSRMVQEFESLLLSG